MVPLALPATKSEWLMPNARTCPAPFTFAMPVTEPIVPVEPGPAPASKVEFEMPAMV